ncbi:uncharacterized protein TNCV_5018571 [Trichonephila clavipes]|nr:uncharacterized protein TNCV_5018571 [Trichonephila clavipes]
MSPPYFGIIITFETSRPSGIVVSDADCGAVGHGFESRRKGMDVCKCIVPARHGGTLNSRRAASSLERLVEGEERWKTPDHSQIVVPQNWGKTEQNRTVIT